MDIKLFSLCKQEPGEITAEQKNILDCVKNFFPDSKGFAHFTSQKRMLVAVSQSLRAADIVLIAVQHSMYNATKRLLSAALDLKLEPNAEIKDKLSLLLNNGKIKQAAFDANSVFPSGAEVFPTSVGLTAGFAITSGGQHIIYMPIEGEIVPEIVFGSLYDYFAAISDPYVASSAIQQRHSLIAERTIKKLSEKYVRVAVTKENCGSLIQTFAPDKRAFKNCFVIDDKLENRADQNIKSYYIDAARKIREDHHAQFGAAISNTFSESNEVFAYITIADESGTNVIKIFAEDGETPTELIKVCIDKLMLMLYDYNKLAFSSAGSVTEEASDKKLRKLLASIAGAAIGASAIIGTVIALILN